MIHAPGLLQLIVGEIGAQHVQRLDVRKLALVDGLRPFRLLDRFLNYLYLALLWLIEFDFRRVGVEFFAALRSIILVVAKYLEEVLQDQPQGRDRDRIDRPVLICGRPGRCKRFLKKIGT